MQDYQFHLESLRREAAEAQLTSQLTTVPEKRERFSNLAVHLQTLAGELETAMAAEAKAISKQADCEPGPA
jgi:hypothetical protein